MQIDLILTRNTKIFIFRKLGNRVFIIPIPEPVVWWPMFAAFAFMLVLASNLFADVPLDREECFIFLFRLPNY